MKLKVNVQEGFNKTYHPLQFRAFWDDEGYCYLRVKNIDGKFVFLCSQLLNYYNTSITNAVESVRQSAINALIQDGALKFKDQNTFFDLFKSSQRRSNELHSLIYEYINANSIWVEHYDSSISITYGDRYSIVKLVGNSDPQWYPTTKEKLENEYPSFDFSIPEEELRNWWSARLSTQGIKEMLKEKDWSMKEVAVRWNRSESWMSKIVNDENRELYWEDAFKGLPSKKNVKEL
ncbi:hypothetical protein LVQ78_23355 [Buttiauxella sp. A2-C2_NF]|uniref:hypothetical protein n=1 Tax=Buttiauxella ferragutiae TaxID=82989 RepID=UPI001E38F50A|nr:hypothetical protein [Buttiauxella ferragutiae]MCE0828932.1 hypothetical protein [Buttiauxella ferragutiae]